MKIQKIQTTSRFAAVIMAAATILGSCINSDYDLSNLDLTLSSNVNLTLPTSSSSDITLASFIKENKNDYISTFDLGDGGDSIFMIHFQDTTHFYFNNIFDGYVIPIKNASVKDTMTLKFEFKNLPKILTDENTVLDLQHPVITMFANSQLPNKEIKITSEADVHSIRGNDTTATTHVNELAFYDGKSKHLIYEDGTTTKMMPPAAAYDELTSRYSDFVYNDYAEYFRRSASVGNGEITKLMLKVPDSIHVKLLKMKASNAGGQVYSGDYPQVQYYHLYAPMLIGPKFNLQYTTDETDWAKDFNDIKQLSDTARIYLTGNFSNTMPMDADVSVVPLGLDGDTLRCLPPNITTVKSGTENSPFQYELKSLDSRYTITDYFMGRNGAPRLDGIRVTCRLHDDSKKAVGQYMRTTVAVKMKDISIRITGKIIYDAN